MKKMIMVVIAAVLCVAIAAPAALAAVNTSVEVQTSGTGTPIVKCVWITPDDCDEYFVAPCEQPPYHDCTGAVAFEPGTQINPNPGTVDCALTPPTQIGSKPVQYWAVVTDPTTNNTTDINGVWVDVYHPDVVMEQNLYGQPDPSGEWCGSFKYEEQLYMFENGDPILGAQQVQFAWDSHIIVFNTAYFNGMGITDPAAMLAEVLYELDQNQADVYKGENTLDNHQPCGDYIVTTVARDWGGLRGDLGNTMEFCCVPGLEIDFDGGVNYGNVVESTRGVNKRETQKGGDDDICTPDAPTVWNSGNTYLTLFVQQDDMGFGEMSGQSNVEYAARLGGDAAGMKVDYMPDALTELPGRLVMCTPTKLDLFITVWKAPDGPTTYSGTLDVTFTQAPFAPCDGTV